jgi:hypothetical protein
MLTPWVLQLSVQVIYLYTGGFQHFFIDGTTSTYHILWNPYHMAHCYIFPKKVYDSPELNYEIKWNPYEAK